MHGADTVPGVRAAARVPRAPRFSPIFVTKKMTGFESLESLVLTCVHICNMHVDLGNMHVDMHFYNTRPKQ